MAPIRAEAPRPQAHLAMARRGRPAVRAYYVARAATPPAHAGPRALPGRMRLRVAPELVYRVVCGGDATVPGAISALGTTSSSAISFVSPPAKVMRIAVSSSDE